MPFITPWSDVSSLRLKQQGSAMFTLALQTESFTSTIWLLVKRQAYSSINLISAKVSCTDVTRSPLETSHGIRSCLCWQALISMATSISGQCKISMRMIIKREQHSQWSQFPPKWWMRALAPKRMKKKKNRTTWWSEELVGNSLGFLCRYWAWQISVIIRQRQLKTSSLRQLKIISQKQLKFSRQKHLKMSWQKQRKQKKRHRQLRL